LKKGKKKQLKTYGSRPVSVCHMIMYVLEVCYHDITQTACRYVTKSTTPGAVGDKDELISFLGQKVTERSSHRPHVVI